MTNNKHFFILAFLLLFAQAIQAQCNSISGHTYLGEHNGHSYYLSDTPTTWAQAKTLAENEGGYLATMNDQAENNFLKNQLNNQMVFIGYNDATTEGTGQWANGDPITLDLSYSNSSENDYAVMNFWAGTWQMVNQYVWKPYILEKSCSSTGGNTDFVTTWKTYGANQIITIPTFDGAIYDYTIDWGDGQISTHVTGDTIHQYSTPNTYQVAISGLFPRIYLEKFDWLNYEALQSIDQWGNNPWTSMEGAFNGAYTMDILATDSPDLSHVTSMKNMLTKVKLILPAINNWDVSHITNMEGLFNYCEFNQDISSWDVSHVTNMKSMFLGARYFNQNIDNWDVSHVTNMAKMFSTTGNFNQNLNSWNVSKVTNMAQMFNSVAFNGQIDNWDVSHVTNMAGMFYSAYSFNQPINSWNVSNVTNMDRMFYDTRYFNQDLNSWNVSNVTNMARMFYDSRYFNGNISDWNVAKVTNMRQMFKNAKLFNQDLSNWSTGNVTNMKEMFSRCSDFNSDIGNWNVSKVTDMSWMFSYNLLFNQDLNNWSVDQVTNMKRMFSNAQAFDHDISDWNVSQVTNMVNMFRHANSFKSNIGSWNIQNVTNMNYMFADITLPTAIYDAILIGWSAQNLQSNVKFHGGNSSYCDGATARAKLIDNFGWTITDVGPDPACSGQNTCGDIVGFTQLGELNGHGYYISDASVPWAQAKTLAENAGGYLATIANQDENDFIQNSLNNQMVFIGYNDAAAEGTGQWANNQPVNIDLSYNNNDENDYAVMNFWAGTWQMVNQWVYKPFILEMECSSTPDVTCLAIGQTFGTQGQVDSFPILHPGCTTVLGQIRIGNFAYQGDPSNITNLNGLSSIKEIKKSCVIKNNSNLTSLQGLHNLEKIGKDLSISGHSLQHLSLNELMQVDENTSITECNALTDLQGLNKLKVIKKDFRIKNCGNLQNLQGLNMLQHIGGSFYIGGDKSSYFYYIFQGGNHTLNSIAGLESLDSISGDFVLMDNPLLINLQGPSQLKKVNNLVIGGCNLLQNFQGLESLRHVKSLELNPINTSYYNGSGFAFTKSNNSFYDFVGLEGLEHIESIQVGTNPNLNSFNGLPTITALTNLIITNNTSLQNFQGLNQLTEIKNNLIVGWGSTQDGQYSHYVIPVGSAISSFSGLENLSKVKNFYIGYSKNLTNFVGLENLQIVENNFFVGTYNRACINLFSNADIYFYGNTSLASFEGLSSLASIGGTFQLIGHNLITDFTHLGALQTIGSLKINSPEVVSLNGLSSLNNISNDIAFGGYESLAGKLSDISLLSFVQTLNGNLSLYNVDTLTNLHGLENLKHVNGNVQILGMNNLTNLNGVIGLEHIGGTFTLGKHTVHGLYCDSRYGNIWENKNSFNPALVSIDGLNSLKTIGNSFIFEGNPLISSLSPLSSLETIGFKLQISKNNNLADISIFNNVSIGSSIIISDNPNLSTCNHQWICDILETHPNWVQISNNAGGCNSVADIDCGSTSGSCDVIVEFTKLGEFNGHGYYLSDASTNWNQAKTLAENAGGYLATMNNQAENDFLKSNLNNKMVFIGYNDAATEGIGTWANNEAVTLDLSYANTPEQDYAVMNFWAGTWQMVNQFVAKNFIMEMNCNGNVPQPTPPISLTKKHALISIHPNPAQDYLTTRILANMDETVKITIFNATGQAKSITSNQLVKGTNEIGFEIQDLEPGIYFLQARGKYVNQTIRFIKIN